MENIRLMPIQKEAYNRYIKNGHRLLLSLPTGAGKTVVAVYTIKHELTSKKDRVLVITPANLTDNIKNTLQRFYPEIKAVIMKDRNLIDDYYNNFQVLICSYNFARMYFERLFNKEFKLLVVDELQYAKNMSSTNYKVLIKLAFKIPHFLGLTASPYSNQPNEFFALLFMASRDKRVLKYYKQFIKYKTIKLKTPTGRIQKKQIPYDILLKPIFRSMFGKWIFWPTEEMVRKSGKGPKPELHIVKVPITKQEYVDYLYALKKIPPTLLQRFKQGTLTNQELMKIKSWLMTAEQVLLSPDAIYKDVENPRPGSKIKFVGEMIKKSNEPSIVFSQFVKYGVQCANNYFNSIGLRSVEYSGKVSRDKRRQIEDDFNSGKIDVICLNTAGAEGINLPTCKNVYFLSLHFNPELLKQVQGRALRITSKYETVNVYWMLAYYKLGGIIPKSTIDEWMAKIVLSKKSFRDTLQKVIIQDYNF